jgi:lipopolysaccharide export system permease protein
MQLSATLSVYIGRQFLLWFAAILGGMLSIIYLLDTVELLRRAANKFDTSFELVVTMGLLKLPEIGQEVVPFVILFGAMYTLWRLTRTQELVVARASGISVWQFMAPVLLVSMLVGVFQITVLNPVFSAMLSRYEQLENRYLRGQRSTLDIARSGLWLRQAGDRQSYVIHAESVVPGTLELQNVMIILTDNTAGILGRLDASTAVLNDGAWDLRSVWYNEAGKPAKLFDTWRLETDLTEERIQESFASPDTMSFWELPSFIDRLEQTGLSSVRHRLYWHTLLAQPFLFCAMVLLAAAFALRHGRHGGTLILVGAGISTALLFFVLKDVVQALGQSGTIPVLLAAWAPAGIGLMLGTAALLHLEDG